MALDTESSASKLPSIYLCGLPCSGNALLTKLFQAAGAKLVNLDHGDIQGDSECFAYRRILGMPTERWFIVIPVRDPEVRLESCRRKFPDSRQFQDSAWQDETRHRILSTASRLNVPTRFVSYEAIVQNCEGVKNDLLDWVSLPHIPWPVFIYDGNEKYQKQVSQ